MATLIDVGEALVSLIAAALYPDGTENPCAAGVDCKVFMGWPTPAQLDADMAASLINISVWPRQGDERNTNNNQERWQTVVEPDPTLTLTIDGQTVTVGGTVSIPQVVSLTIQNTAYPYEVLEADTLETIAAALVALVVDDYPEATSTDEVITLPDYANLLAARVGTVGTEVRELRRQERGYQVTVWANTPANRASIGAFVDSALAPVRFIDMADFTKAKLTFGGSNISDEQEKTRIYRYDFIFRVDYSTVETQQTMQIVNPIVDVDVTLEAI